MPDTAPCRNCPERYPGCHGQCDKYKQMVNELHAKQAWLKEQDKLSPYRPALGDDDVARHVQRKTWGGYPHRRKKPN